MDINKNERREMFRGEIYLIDLSPVVESEQGSLRPCLIVSNDMGNKFSPNITILPLTSIMNKRPLPVHILVEEGKFGLDKESFIMCEGIRTVSKNRAREYVGKVDANTIVKVENAMLINLGMFS